MYQSSIIQAILYTYVYIYTFVERTCMREKGILSYLFGCFCTLGSV